MSSQPPVDRRDFLKTGAAAVGTVSALGLSARTYSRAAGSNERIGVAFLGTGGRCMTSHLHILSTWQREKKNGVEIVGVCDVWDGNKNCGYFVADLRDGSNRRDVGRGLFPAAELAGLNADDKKHVVRDYRRLLELPEVDVVCVATPDHWHAKMCIDAAAAGKDVYCEKPMTKTIAEATGVVDAMKKHNRVMTVGVQSMADPSWLRANELIRAGKIGHVAQAQTSYYRNSAMGQWRYYKLTEDMTPKTVDWDMFLGHGFEVTPGLPIGPKMDFDRAVYGQWRCYWPFGGGMFTDLFVHQTTHLIAAMGVRYPGRVVGAGGIYLEYDGRDVPDVATIVADYGEGCQLMVTATMISAYPIEEVIRGRLGTIKFVKGGFEVIKEDPKGSPGIPARLEDRVKGEFVDCNPPKGAHADTIALWEDFLRCVRERKRETLSTPELGAAAFTTVALGVESYRKGQVMYWDREKRTPTTEGTWAGPLEKRSHEHGKPSEVPGYTASQPLGSSLQPPEYQKLAGPWVGGKDPAAG
jgi:predicted dehydrogenase